MTHRKRSFYSRLGYLKAPTAQEATKERDKDQTGLTSGTYKVESGQWGPYEVNHDTVM